MNISKHLNETHKTLLIIIGTIADDMNFHAYLVGGYVRDILIKSTNIGKDLDIVLIDPTKKTKKLGVLFAKEVVKQFSKIGDTTEVQYFQNFGTAQFKFDGIEFEFVGARKESYDRNSRKPVVEDGTLKDDTLRRDFTINDMYMVLNQKTDLNFGDIYDPFRGLADLENKIIKTPQDPNITFSDDPLRMMRAIRFSAKLGFELSDETYVAIIDNAHRIKIISKERISTEINKIFKTNRSHIGIKLMADLGLLKLILPEVYDLKGKEWKIGKDGKTRIYHKDNLYHVIQVLKNIDKLPDKVKTQIGDKIEWFRWAALLHDIGKTKTKQFDINADSNGNWTFHAHQIESTKMADKVFRRMKLPLGVEWKYAKFIIANHERIKLSAMGTGDSPIRRLIIKTQEEVGDDKYIFDLFIFGRCDTSSSKPEIRAKRKETYTTLYERSQEVKEKDNLTNFQPPVSGDEIMKLFDLKPSRNVGIIKDEQKDAIIEGRIPNDYDACKKYIIEFAKNNLNLNTNE